MALMSLMAERVYHVAGFFNKCTLPTNLQAENQDMKRMQRKIKGGRIFRPPHYSFAKCRLAVLTFPLE